MTRAIILWILVGVTGAAVLPWYALYDGLFSAGWLRAYPNAETGSALYQIAVANRFWLLAPLAPLAAAFVVAVMRLATAETAKLLMWLSIAGMALLLLQGFAIIHNGPSTGLIGLLAPAGAKQPGMGYGALALGASYLMLLSCALAAQGYCRGDLFVVGSISLVVALIALFVFFPVLTILASAP
jgi:iron(III) transport system permease protein